MLYFTEAFGKRCFYSSSLRIAVFRSNPFEIGRYRSRCYAAHLYPDFSNVTFFAGHRTKHLKEFAHNKHSGVIIDGENLLKRWGSGGGSISNVRPVDWHYLRSWVKNSATNHAIFSNSATNHAVFSNLTCIVMDRHQKTNAIILIVYPLAYVRYPRKVAQPWKHHQAWTHCTRYETTVRHKSKEVI